MTPETRKALRKSSINRSKNIRKQRLDKFLTNQDFYNSYVTPPIINIDDTYLTCYFRTNHNYTEDCGICQECCFIYCH